MLNRRKAREAVLKILYSREFQPARDIDCLIDEFWHMDSRSFEIPISQDKPSDKDTFELEDASELEQNGRNFVKEVVLGTYSNMAEIDNLIEKSAKNWTLQRMSYIDRNILRFAVYEILYCDDIPVKVSINEALEVAKKYGAPDSVRFINGILDAISNGL